MKRLLCAALMVVGTMTAAGIAMPLSAQAAPPNRLVCDNEKNDPYTGTYASVTVPEGASCYLKDAVVRGNVKALHGSGDVYILDTEVRRNIMVRKSRGTVKIGAAGCRVDPPAGNNIKVTRSHNVLICWMTVGNNIAVTRNDGRITLLHNTVGSNIKVSKNLPYDPKPGDGQHQQIDAIRLRHNVAERHIWVTDNADRPVLQVNNTPEPII
jgi:hypothetical protein